MSLKPTPTPQLSYEELARYQRQLMLPQVGREGQLRLKKARVLVVGVGGLGATAALYLAAGGVGRLGLIDNDIVDLTNLHRQVIYRTDEIGLSKVESTALHLKALNPLIKVKRYATHLTKENAQSIIADYDLVVDGTDNFKTRYLLNDICLLVKKPFIFASVSQFTGHLSTVLPFESGCYRCLFSQEPPPEHSGNCAEQGVLGVLPGTLALLQATEVFKYFLNIGSLLSNRLLRYDLLNSRFSEITYSRDADCPACGSGKILAPFDESSLACSSFGNSAFAEFSIHYSEAKKKNFTWVDIREAHEFSVSTLENSLSIPQDSLDAHHEILNTGQPVILFCQSGQRSHRLLTKLKNAQIENIFELKGGLNTVPLTEHTTANEHTTATKSETAAKPQQATT